MNASKDEGLVCPSDLPLAGLRVLDFTWLLPGPFATLLLADLGADVIKVERPGSGDYLRNILPAMFEHINRGKRSITIDLKDSDAHSDLLKLVSSSDVVLEGFRPGVADRIGIGYDALSAVRSDLIYVSISGYGQTGPYKALPGHDINYLAMSGALFVPASWNEKPHRSGLPVADLTAALYATVNISAAVRKRDKTGKGSRIDLSIAEAALHWSEVRMAGVDSDKPTWHHIHPANDVFETKDGRELSIALVEEKFFLSFCAAIDRHDLHNRFESVEQITKDHSAAAALHAELVHIFKQHSLEEWVKTLGQSDVPFAPVSNPNEVRQNQHLNARGLFDNTFMSIPGGLGTRKDMSAAPEIGEHTHEILSELK
ncbi:CoA transferase [Sneathiella chungangensis]|uniref:CoA transferase n=1 Tax=Sneathiella chungangensis TaxID=1418234 RepID=A0A845MGE8_9PROT|nr:CaiB/BaiF CoA-transferase family protein [Sneathiella chungangensis]MZR22702.1 CoA transferase [Sneathiella chungangensis]